MKLMLTSLCSTQLICKRALGMCCKVFKKLLFICEIINKDQNLLNILINNPTSLTV